MDKYEFDLKVEQLNKLVKSGDYKAAMRITDTIDWRRVHKAELLATVSEVYEKNNEYKEARDILLLSYDRAPVGKRILYKLAMLAIKLGDIEEAQAYYKEYTEISPQDSRKYLMEYYIADAKGENINKKIRILEKYNDIERTDEQWKFELAQLYAKVGRIDDCVKTCDEIMLLFGVGEYVDKAAALKESTGCPLSSKQLELVENKEYYEERLNILAEKYESGDRDNYPNLNLDDMSAYKPREDKKTTINLGSEEPDVGTPISKELFPRNGGVNEARISETTFKGESVNPEFELELKRAIAITKANLDEMNKNEGHSSMEEIDEEVRARMEKVERIKHGRFISPPVMSERRKTRISNYFDSMGLPRTYFNRAENDDMEIEAKTWISDDSEEQPIEQSIEQPMEQPLEQSVNELATGEIYPDTNESVKPDEEGYEEGYDDGLKTAPDISNIKDEETSKDEVISEPADIGTNDTKDNVGAEKEPQQNITVTETASTKVLENYVPEKKAPIFDSDDLINSYYDEETETGVPTVSGVIAQIKEQKDVVQSSIRSESKMEVVDDEEVYYTKEERTFVTKVKKGEVPREIIVEPKVEVEDYDKTITVEEKEDSDDVIDDVIKDDGVVEEANDIKKTAEKEIKPSAERIQIATKTEPKDIKRAVEKNISKPEKENSDTVVIEESEREITDREDKETKLPVHGKETKAKATKQREEREFLMRRPGSIVVEGITAQKALENAIEVLKEVNALTKIKRPVLKIGAVSLNARGVKNSIDKIKGKDLIIVEAGELDDKTIGELIEFIKDGKETVVFSDTAEGIENLLKANELLHGMSLVLREEEVPVKRKNIVANIVIKEKEDKRPQKSVNEEIEITEKETVQPEINTENKQPDLNSGFESDFDNVEKILKQIYGDENIKLDIKEIGSADTISVYSPQREQREEIPNAVFTEPKENIEAFDADYREVEPKDIPPADTGAVTQDNMPIGLNQFISYAVDYVKEIECVLSGRAEDAIEERADYMREDGTPLTKKNARNLVDHAADIAEKASMLKAIFKPKYDKDGRLILREEHFKI